MKESRIDQRVVLGYALLGIIVAGLLGLQASQASPPQQINKPGPLLTKKPARQTLAYLKNETDAWKVLNNPQVLRRMKTAMGSDIEQFWDCTQETSTLLCSKNDLFTTGSVMGLSGDRLSFFNLNVASGRCCLGYLIDGTEHIYGATRRKDLPKPVSDYLAKTGDIKDVTFEKPNPDPAPPAKVTPVKNGLNTKCLTGTYERAPGRFTSGQLLVQALPHGQIKFSNDASNGGHTGGVVATVPLVDNRAVYKSSDVSLGVVDEPAYVELIFCGQRVEIGGTNGAFCGAAVTLVGTYIKTDDQIPKFAE